jgi:8-oxo-dGTP diphosphatase
MNNLDKKYPRIGVGVMIMNKKREVLLGLRKGSHGSGEWSFPGGHLEFGAKREVKEETGLDIEKFKLISVADEMRYIKTDNKHYLNIGVEGFYQGGIPEIKEADKCEEWRWFDFENLPNKMLEGTELTINNFKAKKIY